MIGRKIRIANPIIRSAAMGMDLYDDIIIGISAGGGERPFRYDTLNWD